MELMDLETPVRLLEKQVEAAVALLQRTKRDVLSSIDTLKIKVETLKVFPERLHPELPQRYPKFRDDVVRKKMAPEWERSEANRSEK